MSKYSMSKEFLPDGITTTAVHLLNDVITFKSSILEGLREAGLSPEFPDGLEDILTDSSISITFEINDIVIYNFEATGLSSGGTSSGHLIVDSNKGGWIAVHIDGDWTPMQPFKSE